MAAFVVHRPGWKAMYLPHLNYPITSDTVFYSDRDHVTPDEVKRALVDHDGYPSDIIVRKHDK